MGLPGGAEADVRGANRAPDEQVGQPGQREQPREDGALVGCQADEGQQAKGNLQHDAPDRATLAVDVGHDLGSHTTLRHGLDGPGRAEGAGVGDRDDSQGDDDVEDGGENLDTGVLDGKHEWRCFGICARSTLQPGIVRGKDEADNEEVDDVEEEDSPESLLRRPGDGLPGVVRLSGSETDELCSTEGKGCGDEDRAETTEAVPESAWLVPVLDTDVALVSHASAINDDAQDDEADTSADLDHG